jgi:hypothetical protein
VQRPHDHVLANRDDLVTSAPLGVVGSTAAIAQRKPACDGSGSNTTSRSSVVG